MITGVILNWKRPDNLRRILAGWRDGGLVSEAIVWNNNPSAAVRHDWAKVVNASQDFGLYSRFAAAAFAGSECVLIQDDDLLLPAESVRTLHRAWSADPAVLHGAFGRRPRRDRSYARRVRGDAEAPVVLTRALLAARRLAVKFFEAAAAFDGIQRDSSPYGNGEDIIFSFLAQLESGRLNRVHRVAVTELPDRDAINGRDRGDTSNTARGCFARVKGGWPRSGWRLGNAGRRVNQLEEALSPPRVRAT